MPETISYFDCNASIGAPASGVFQPCLTADELLRELDWVGVERALVHHALMRDQSPAVGNAILAESIRGQPRLVGAWAILPPQTGELLPAPAFFHAMREQNIKALWAFPEEQRYLLRGKVFGAFLQQISDRRIPLFVSRQAAGLRPAESWQLVYDLLDDYPDLTLVVAAHGPWGEDRFFRPLLEQHARFHLDISRYELDCGLCELVHIYGAERLLYGSSFPDRSMGGPRLMVAHAGLEDDARRAIAGANLARLLAEVDLT
jgi:predicted TIM-barrel fold metal-dependent hydrolase